jgi:hypothetical protein
MTLTTTRTSSLVLAASILALALALTLTGARSARATSTPVGPLPAGPVSGTTTKPGLLVAVALRDPRRKTGLVWRLARRYDPRVLRQVSEADLGTTIVLVYRVIGRGDTALRFALTRGDTSPKALKSATYKVNSR